MAKYVPDITTNRWVIVAEGRTKRPHEDKTVPGAAKVCVFCAGNEKLPGEELFRMGLGKAYEPGWTVRVILNKYPITDFHEVIIHSPSHTDDLEVLPVSHVEQIIKTYRARYTANYNTGHVIIFDNVGEVAGASLSHPHSQLVVVPRQINLDSLRFEPTVNVFSENNNFSVFCPEFSQWPFEVWIAPKRRNEFFGEIKDDATGDLASILQMTLRKLMFHLSDAKHAHPGMPMIYFKHGPAYNFYIYHGRDWFIRIIPRLVHRAGFELGTGLSVNIIDPADAAEILRADVDAKDRGGQGD